MATKDEKFLRQARDRWKLAETAEQKQRDREKEDLKFYAGEQWPTDLLTARKGITLGSGSGQQVVPARPSLVINKTLEPVRQVLNQERQSDLGFELIPADDFGETNGPIDHTEIELREGLVRRIQRDSEAADARTWGFTRAAIAGRGYWVIMTRYLPGKRADQEVYIERIYNQSSVRLDPSREQPDGSDAEWGFYGTDMLWSAFKQEYPKARVSDLDNEGEWRSIQEEMPGWFTGEGEGRAVRLMNYYYTEREAKTLYHLSNGQAAYKDELEQLPPGVTVLTDEDGSEQTHTETQRTVEWCKMVGNEVLDRTTWPGRWVPIMQVIGEELQPYDDERRAQGIVRPMLDACKGNNYIVSKFVERVGLTPIPPWMMAAGQDEGFEDEYNASTTRTISRLHYNQKDSNEMMVPSPPFRTDVRAEISDLAAGVQIFSQAIVSTSVSPETALGHADSTVKSGKLAKALIEQSERGTSNFMDNLVRSMRHEARVINDLLYPIYGRSGRLARIMNGQGEMQAMLIDKPFTMVGQGKQQKPQPVPDQMIQAGQVPPNAKTYKLTPDADFNVAFKVSKNIETRRQQIMQFLTDLIGADPQQLMVIGDKLWKYADVPDHDEIAERYKVMLAPPIQKLIAGDSPLPPEAQQQIAMLEGQIKDMMPLVDKNKVDLEKAKGQALAETERTVAEIASREKIEKWKLEVQLEIEMAKLGNARMMARAEQDAQLLHTHTEGQLAAQSQAVEGQQALQAQGADAEQAERDRQAAQQTQAADQSFQASESSQDRALQADQAERERQQATLLAEQAAAQPPAES